MQNFAFYWQQKFAKIRTSIMISKFGKPRAQIFVNKAADVLMN